MTLNGKGFDWQTILETLVENFIFYSHHTSNLYNATDTSPITTSLGNFISSVGWKLHKCKSKSQSHQFYDIMGRNNFCRSILFVSQMRFQKIPFIYLWKFKFHALWEYENYRYIARNRRWREIRIHLWKLLHSIVLKRFILYIFHVPGGYKIFCKIEKKVEE